MIEFLYGPLDGLTRATRPKGDFVWADKTGRCFTHPRRACTLYRVSRHPWDASLAVLLYVGGHWVQCWSCGAFYQRRGRKCSLCGAPLRVNV